MTNLVPETEMREVTELNAKINLLLAMSSLADSELRHYNENITRITGELSSKENELARVGAELSSKENEVARVVAELSSKENEVARVGAELSRVGAELSSKENEVARVVAELEAILSSTSWRMTAPLRWLRKKIGQWR